MSSTMRVFLFAALVGVVACDQGLTSTQPSARPQSDVLAAQGGNKCAVVTLYPPAATISVGTTLALVDTVANKKGVVLTDAPVTWASQNPAVAAVSANGVVTGVTTGNATIQATCETGLTASSSITVVP
jgi:uncharacterized protein YjdB